MNVSFEKQVIPSETIFRNGLNPVEAGFKVSLIKTKNEAFASSLISQVGIPFLASADHKPHGIFQRTRLVFENKLSKTIKLDYNIGSDWDNEDKEQNWIYTISPAIELSDKIETFIEAYGYLKSHSVPEHSFDAGLAYYPAKNIKLDLSAGLGLNSAAPDNFIAAGISFCIQHRQQK